MLPIRNTIHHQHLCMYSYEFEQKNTDLVSNFILKFLCIFFLCSIYVVGKVMNWIKKNGGIKAMYDNSLKKSQLIYNRIDQSNGFYSCPIEKPFRSRMNVVYRVGGTDGNDALEKEFLKGAEALQMLQLKGHRSVGGIRASLYNAVTYQDADTLAKYMDEFLAKHKK